jgi:hypothetical protein
MYISFFDYYFYNKYIKIENSTYTRWQLKLHYIIYNKHKPI